MESNDEEVLLRKQEEAALYMQFLSHPAVWLPLVGRFFHLRWLVSRREALILVENTIPYMALGAFFGWLQRSVPYMAVVAALIALVIGFEPERRLYRRGYASINGTRYNVPLPVFVWVLYQGMCFYAAGAALGYWFG